MNNMTFTTPNEHYYYVTTADRELHLSDALVILADSEENAARVYAARTRREAYGAHHGLNYRIVVFPLVENKSFKASIVPEVINVQEVK